MKTLVSSRQDSYMQLIDMSAELPPRVYIKSTIIFEYLSFGNIFKRKIQNLVWKSYVSMSRQKPYMEGEVFKTIINNPTVVKLLDISNFYLHKRLKKIHLLK